MIGSSNMARWIFGRLGGASSSAVPAVAHCLNLSRINVERIILLTSPESRETLNPSQCRSLSSKLERTLESIEILIGSCYGDKAFLNAALENFYLVCDRAKKLVESCSNVDWCQASVFQIQNEEAFKMILLETCLCYSAIFELVEGKFGGNNEDLRSSSTFEPPTSAEILQDQVALIERFRALVDDGEPVNRNQHLAKYLLRRLLCFTSQSNGKDFDVSLFRGDFDDTLSMLPDVLLGRQIDVLLRNSVTKGRLLGVLCAIKEFEINEYSEEWGFQEARIMAFLNHPNIVKFICCGHDDESSRDFIAMELMEQDLHSVIWKLRREKRGNGAASPFPLLSAMDIMLQIAYGACYLHEMGVAHRDIKSWNVVVSRITTPHLKDYLKVKLVDFGLSKSKLRASELYTMTRRRIGTSQYMAPELFNEGRANWFKADVYSFGVLCSVILSGEEPFLERPIFNVFEKVPSGERPMIPLDIPPKLTALIQECWEGNPNDRPDFLDICTRLATLRYELLSGGYRHDDSSQLPLYIQEIFMQRSNARQPNSPYRLPQIPAHLEENLGGASSSTVPAVADFLHLSRINIERIILLTSPESRETLNLSQCRSMSFKLQKSLESIERLISFCYGDKSSLNAALENFYLVSDRAKELVESCSNVDWCQASVFQIQNEEAFQEILLETCLCYSAIFELVDGNFGGNNEDLRSSSTFESPSSAEILQDQVALIERFRAFVDDGEPVNRNQHLAKYLLGRLLCFTSQSNGEDFDAWNRSMWSDGQLRIETEGLLRNSVTKGRLLDVPCAIKEFDIDGDEEGAGAPILREARIFARLNHPNIVKFICCGHDDDNSKEFIAMERMEEGLYCLMKKLRRAKHKEGAFSPFPLLSAVDMMLQIAYGTCYLHEMGIAHRDIKSSNVVVRRITTPHLEDYLQVKLVDFGISKSKLRASKSNTISHLKTGTPVYMAPEAFKGEKANWFKADVYSFGVLCSVILSGKEPFPYKEMPRPMLYEEVCSGRRPMIPLETPRKLTSLIEECWNGDRNRRPDFRDICTRLATLRHKLLRGGDPHGDNFQPPAYIQEMFRRRSDARQLNSPYRLPQNPAHREESLGVASSPTGPAVADFLHLSRINIERIILLTSPESQGTLNPSQCRSMSSKLQRTLESIEEMLRSFDGEKSFLNAALENFYVVCDRAKELVESCSNVDWCQASVFQIQNEEAFKEILLETCLCYSAIFELVDGKFGGYNEDLRNSSTFEPPSSAEILQDQVALIERFRAFVDDGEPVNRNQHLAKYLLRRLRCFSAEDFDVCTLSMCPDDQLGRQIVRLLGNNVTKQRLLDVPCAVKEFVYDEYEEGANALIFKEARTLARLNHPNIVKFICCGHDSKTSRDFIAMEPLEQSLHSLIGKLRREKRGIGAASPFPLLSEVDIMLQIAYGACYLHEMGVAHRDIKSSNVVVSQITTPHLKGYLQVKLVDFGLSKSKLRASESNTISRPKTGTPVYMAPEAFNEGRANWFKADVYSFGVLCSVILSGKEPFSLVKIERSGLYEVVFSGRRPTIPSETPPELTSLIQECWNGDRYGRPDFRDICTRLATLRHKLLRGGDPHGDNCQPPAHIQEMFMKRSDARQLYSLYRRPQNHLEESSVQN